MQDTNLEDMSSGGDGRCTELIFFFMIAQCTKNYINFNILEAQTVASLGVQSERYTVVCSTAVFLVLVDVPLRLFRISRSTLLHSLV